MQNRKYGVSEIKFLAAYVQIQVWIGVEEIKESILSGANDVGKG